MLAVRRCDMEFPDPDDIMNFSVTLKPDEGFWKGGKFTFKFEIPADYPHSPPKTVSVGRGLGCARCPGPALARENVCSRCCSLCRQNLALTRTLRTKHSCA